MSVDHTFKIGADSSCELFLNLSCVDREGDIEIAESNIYAFDITTGISKFTCNLPLQKLSDLYHHLAKYSMVTDTQASSVGKFVEVAESQTEIISFLSTSSSESLLPALQHIVNERLSHADINTILGRRESLSEYEDMLNNADSYVEADWQRFFEANEWIFGYGLAYKYIEILQREAHISRSDLNGSNDVISDFLLSDSRFTKIVELKTPKTSLFENRRNRADSWRLSTALTDAVSQILAQKANWELEGANTNYTSEGNLIHEGAFDVECILVIGSHSSIDGTDRQKLMKSKTFELYRRNLRSIEILTYDELFERAKYIVEGSSEEI